MIKTANSIWARAVEKTNNKSTIIIIIPQINTRNCRCDIFHEEIDERNQQGKQWFLSKMVLAQMVDSLELSY